MNTDSFTCLKCKSKTFEIKETETGNMSILCTSCGGSISPLHPEMSIKGFLEMWHIGIKAQSLKAQ